MTTLADKLAGLHCPRCGHDDTYMVRDVEFTQKVGQNTVTVPITVGVCRVCGEWLLDDTATENVQDAVDALEAARLSDLVRIGDAYKTA